MLVAGSAHPIWPPNPGWPKAVAELVLPKPRKLALPSSPAMTMPRTELAGIPRIEPLRSDAVPSDLTKAAAFSAIERMSELFPVSTSETERRG
jgi:hypothetical protein